MKHSGLIACVVVLLMTAPGASRWLNADGEAGPAAARTVAVGDAKLTVSLDRTSVTDGEPVRLAMVVENPGRHDQPVDVEVAVLERVGSPMARMMPPPVVRHTERVRLLAKAGTTTRQSVVLTVPAAKGRPDGFGRSLTARVTARGAKTPIAIAFVQRPAGSPKGTAVAAAPRPPVAPVRALPRRAAAPAPTSL
jgi:hypothetical protein